MAGKFRWDRAKKRNHDERANLTLDQIRKGESAPTAFCARCKVRHPYEAMFRHRNGYYLCRLGFGARSTGAISKSAKLHSELSEAVERIRKLKKD